MASVRQFAQQYHRDLILVVHDEKRDEGKAVVGTNVSNAVATALAPYGLDGAKRFFCFASTCALAVASSLRLAATFFSLCLPSRRPLFALESFLENEKVCCVRIARFVTAYRLFRSPNASL